MDADRPALTEFARMQDDPEVVERFENRIDELFCRPGAPYGPYRPDGPPEVILSGRLCRAVLKKPGWEADRVDVILFEQLTGMAGDLWEQEIRTLFRLDAMGHPALPKIVAGTRDRDRMVAFTMSQRQGEPVNVDAVARWAGRERQQALEQFSLLLDALAQLHGARILHRNLTLNAIRVAHDGQGGPVSFSLSRFELGASLGNLIRRTSQPDATEAAQRNELIRHIFLRPPAATALARHLAYIAPELHPYVFGSTPGGRRDWETTDVFGLGLFGWELFCGPIPERLPAQYQCIERMVEDNKWDALHGALAELHEKMRKVLRDHKRTGTEVPKPLASLLLAMIDASPQGRDSSFQLAQRLEREWIGIRALWEAEPDEITTRLVGYTRRTVGQLVNLELLPGELATNPAEVTAFFARELKQAQLVWSASGARFLGQGKNLDRACWVLLGAQAAWFCHPHEWRDVDGDLRQLYPEVLTIKHVVERSRVPGLTRSPRRRFVGTIEMVVVAENQSLQSGLEGRPSWEELQSLVQEEPDDDWDRNAEFLRSLDFLLEYHAVQGECRIYAYHRTDQESPGTAVLTVEPTRDREWCHDSDLRSAYMADSKRRPALGDFCRALQADGLVRLELVAAPARTRRPDFSYTAHHVVTVELEERLASDTIRVTAPSGVRIPERGWLRPKGDLGTDIAVRRQLTARAALEGRRALVTCLHNPIPISVELGRDRWSVLDDSELPGPEAEPLRGDAEPRVVDLLSYHPFYALQGPPGTGKTTIVVRAIRRLLSLQPGDRILVAAQSNDALDNLGERLVKELPDKLVLRHASAAVEGKLDEESGTGSRTLLKLVKQQVKKILETLPAQIEDDKDDPELSPGANLREEWLTRVSNSQLELTDRIARQASVVLATCSAASTLNEADEMSADLFDWVIIEEAAKAWPTELIAPLVAGVRWALVGDHKQLGPHRAEELSSFLTSLKGRDSVILKDHYQSYESHMRVVKMFGSLFESQPPGESGPVRQLREQFRMPDAIAQPFARAFYPKEASGASPTDAATADELPESFLTPGDGPMRDAVHGLTSPPELVGAPLVWLDTGNCPECVQEGRWRNRGEADIVDELVRQMHPECRDKDAPVDKERGLVVLAPYKAQVEELSSRERLAGRVHTVHSFQGGEADRVIVSLVRSERSARARKAGPRSASGLPTPVEAGSALVGPNPHDIRAAIGFLGQDEIINVLLSRAMRLLVIVGDFSYFRRNGGEKWRIVTSVTEQQDAWRDAVRVMDCVRSK